MTTTTDRRPTILIASDPAELAVISVPGLAIVDARGRLHEYNNDMRGRGRWWVTGSTDHRGIRDFPVRVVRHPADLEQSIVVTVGELLAATPASFEPGAERLTAADILIARAVPRYRDPATAAYYAATDHKHFGDRSQPGSKFTDPTLNSVEDVVRLAIAQRGSLDGDDRVRFYTNGAEPEAFFNGHRYIRVETPGTVGVIRSTELEDGYPLDVVRTKPGTPVSLVATVTDQPTADYAVLIVSEAGEFGGEVVITAFPGPVVTPVDHPDIEALEGTRPTVAAVRAILGTEFYANTRLSSI